MPRLTRLVLLAAVVIGCGPTGDPVDPGDPGGPGPGPTDPGSTCTGPGGVTCEVTADCAAPLLCLDGVCASPQDPGVACDPVEGILCPAGRVCLAGACVTDPDVSGGQTCSDPGPGPPLSGTWAMRSHLHLREALPGLAAGLLDVSELLADFIEGDADLGLPSAVEAIIGALVAEVIAEYVPPWAQELILLLAGFSDVLDDLQVDSTVWLSGTACDANYRGRSQWDRITFEYRGMIVSQAPASIPEIGPVTPEDFGARYACGQLYIDRHRVHNVLRGLVRWVADTLAEIVTGHPTLESALDATVDCGAVAIALDSAWRSACGCATSITSEVYAACASYEADLLAQLTAALNAASLELSVLSLEGIADVPDASHLTRGVWHGELLGGEFPGEFTAQK